MHTSVRQPVMNDALHAEGRGRTVLVEPLAAVELGARLVLLTNELSRQDCTPVAYHRFSGW